MSEAASAERTRVKAKAPATPVNQPAQPQPAQPRGANPQTTNNSSNRVAELQVTAHLMSLDTGLFCVFQTPGSPAPDLSTGLPGVRITPAPGMAGRPEAVSVSTFREDGWLNGTAALVRVTDGSAQILVTIYQHKGQDAAPSLQVLRLSAEPTAADARTGGVPVVPMPNGPQAADPVAPESNPEVMAHVQRSGDLTCMLGDWLGIKGSRQWIEGFGLAPANGISLQDIEYQAVLGRNWLSPWVEGGKFCGSRGMALPLLGLKVRLKGAAAKAFECTYSATFVDGSAVGPVSGGETCEAESLAALEAFQIVLQPRGGQSVAPVAKTDAKAASASITLSKAGAAKVGAARSPAEKPKSGKAPIASKTAIKPRAMK